jgi:hypothetical protein
VDFTPEPIEGVRIWQVSHLSTEALVQQLQANPLPPLPDNRHFGKLYQWDKLQVFDSYFTQWERVVFLDAGMRVLDSVEPLLNLEWRGKFLAPDDSQPYDNGKRFRIQICKDANLEASKRLFEDYSESMLESHYFNNCIFLYDTSLLETVKVEELERCMNRYPLFWCNEVGVMNLIFTIKLGVWSPFPERVGDKYLFGWNESNYRESPKWNAFHFIKYSSTYSPMNTISSTFTSLCRTPSDISEHLPTLAGYASICSHVTECGVRGAVSSYAFANSMLGRPGCTLVQVDPYRSTASDTFRLQCKQENVPVIFHEMSDLGGLEIQKDIAVRFNDNELECFMNDNKQNYDSKSGQCLANFNDNEQLKSTNCVASIKFDKSNGMPKRRMIIDAEKIYYRLSTAIWNEEQTSLACEGNVGYTVSICKLNISK